MMKIAFVTLLAATVLLIIGNVTEAPLTFAAGRACMVLSVLSTLASFTVKLIADTNTQSLRYRR